MARGAMLRKTFKFFSRSSGLGKRYSNSSNSIHSRTVVGLCTWYESIRGFDILNPQLRQDWETEPHGYNVFEFKMATTRVSEMERHASVLAALTEDPGLVPITHIKPLELQQPVTWAPK